MLSFDSALTNSLKLSNTTAFYVLKLYYNAEGTSDYIGLSEKHREDGLYTYYGLVTSWGQLHQSLDFFNFTTSTGNVTVKLVNTDNSYKGGRFSDQFSTNNFANRKWELFLNTEGLSTYDTSARMIGTGIISGDIKYDQKYVEFRLLDLGSRVHKRLPINIVDSSTYPNAPEKNVDKPIPISYGDFYTFPDGTLLTSGAEFDRHYVLGRFPAIISNKWDDTDAKVEALADNAAIDILYAKNIYHRINDNWAACEDANVDITNNPTIQFAGGVWYAYFKLSDHASGGGTNWDRANDEIFNTTTLLSAGSGTNKYGYLYIDKIPKLGELSTISVIFHFNDMSTYAPNPGPFRIRVHDTTNFTLTWTTGINGQTEDITSHFSTAEQDGWDFEGELRLDLLNTSGPTSVWVDVVEIGIEVKFTPSQTFSKLVDDLFETTIRGNTLKDEFDEGISVPETVKIAGMLKTPSIVDYIYYSGKGREYGAWIDDIDGGTDNRTDYNGSEPDPNYTEGDLIENPVYMIEDILRTELSLDSSTDGSDIDIETFDRSGNAQTDSTKGDIAFIFNDAIADIKFAFSQYKFINSKDLIDKICKQIMSYVWISGDGKFKIRTLLRSTDTWNSDKTINYRDIKNIKISKTPLSSVRNEIIINYAHDYGQEQNLKQAKPTKDATSTGTTVDGYKQDLKLILDADFILDDDTAGNTAGKGLADAYMNVFKDRKNIIKFDCLRPEYLDLEIGDIIQFSNWDTNVKLYGTALNESNDYFMVTDIGKKLNKISMEVIQVS